MLPHVRWSAPATTFACYERPSVAFNCIITYCIIALARKLLSNKTHLIQTRIPMFGDYMQSCYLLTMRLPTLL